MNQLLEKSPLNLPPRMRIAALMAAVFVLFSLKTETAFAKTGTRMRASKRVAVAADVVLAWSPNPSTGNLVDGPLTITLRNTGTSAATNLTFSLPIYAGSASSIPGNQGDIPNWYGAYIYISDHTCGSTLNAGSNCTVTFKPSFNHNSMYFSDTCTATSNSVSSTLTNLVYDNSI